MICKAHFLRVAGKTLPLLYTFFTRERVWWAWFFCLLEVVLCVLVFGLPFLAKRGHNGAHHHTRWRRIVLSDAYAYVFRWSATL